MSALRLELVARTYKEGERWTWRLWSGARIVASSGSQRFSRRTDCADGARTGCNIWNLMISRDGDVIGVAFRPIPDGTREFVEVRIRDQRKASQ